MSYQVLARKWRPADFSSLVGQDHVVTALRNALADDRVAQAYLFSGIRGVGKTTAARLLAKALNCKAQDGPAAEPCNECEACLEIGAGSSMDVVEVDAATYSKVEQVRELTETLRYGPANNRYKVVVLDEVHRLSRQAFDALLKIVEEPPAHLVFIFATTEIDAVPATILSRCQEFQFRRVPSPVVADHLRRLADAEEIEVSDNALRLIARAGEGSVRDSVALLDQMSTFGSGTIEDEDAAQLLGGFDAAVFLELLGAILGGDGPTVIRVAREVDARGWDPHHVYGQFLSFCRDGLHLAMGGDSTSVDLPAEEAESLAETVRQSGYEGLLQVLQLLLTSEAMVRRSEFSSVALEVAWLRAAELPKVRRIEHLLGGDPPSSASGTGSGSSGESSGPGSGSARRGTGAGSRSTATQSASERSPVARNAVERSPATRNAAARNAVAGNADTRNALTRKTEAEKTEAEKTEAEKTQVKETQSPATTEASKAEASKTEARPLELDESRLADLLDLVASRKQSLAAHLRNARMGCREGRLVIAPRDDDRLLPAALGRGRNAKVLDKALLQVFGDEVEWTLDPRARNLPPAPAAATSGDDDGSDRSSAPPLELYEEENRQQGQVRQEERDEDGRLDQEMAGPNGSAQAADRDRSTDLDAFPVARRILEEFKGNILGMRDRDRSSTHQEIPR